MRDLEGHRLEAARASGGASSGPIYRAFLAAIRDRELGGRVLDFGAGRGNLTRLLDGFDEVSAVDIVSRPADLDVSWESHDLNVPTTYGDGSFDVIVSAEVIEHLENPRAVAREWFRLLAPGGHVLFSTPNNESIRSYLSFVFRGHFVEFLPSSYPAHITPLVRMDMERVLREAGFQEPEFRYTDHGCIPGFVKHRWQALGARLFRGRLFSDNVLAVARRPRRSA